MAIPHPGGAHALKAEAEGKSFVYATDTEHTPGAPMKISSHFCTAPIWPFTIALSMTTSLIKNEGWGHSTWQEGVRLANAAEVKRFGIFHHEPERTDSESGRN